MTKLYSERDDNRLLPEKESLTPGRTNFFRDYGRVIHSSSFRRLQGKTQVFPLKESDFFRSRLTHSLEVAHVARGIASKLNAECDCLKDNPINEDLVTTCGLVHDIGHPPFGHNGERALDDCMKKHGGFEGNAQTLRILSKLEKKVVKDGVSYGLNLTYRTLASIIKYDNLIPEKRSKKSDIQKGFYQEEKDLVKRIKKNLILEPTSKKFKTIECQIMDIADDIAYSTYDLEDCFKVGLLDPIKIFNSSDGIFDQLSSKLTKIFGKDYNKDQIIKLFEGLFSCDVKYPIEDFKDFLKINKKYKGFSKNTEQRTNLSSTLVGAAIKNTTIIEYDKNNPLLTQVKIDEKSRVIIETLKNYTYLSMINSPIVKIPEYRGYEIVKSIFDSFCSDSGYKLLPEDVLDEYSNSDTTQEKYRVVCDFIAGMTDRYIMEFYERLHSNSAQSMFKPL